MIKKKICIFGLLTAALLCSGYSYKGEHSRIDFTVSEDYVASDEFLGTVQLNGKYIKLPAKASLVLDEGFDIEDRFHTYKPLSASFSADAVDSNGRYLKMYVENNENKEMDVTDCNVYEIEYDGENDAGYGYVDFEVQGVKVGDTEADAVAALGESNHTWLAEFNGVKYLSWETPKKDVEIQFGSKDGKIVSMKVTVDSTGQEYQYAHKEFDVGDYGDDDVDIMDPVPVKKQSSGASLIVMVLTPLVIITIVGITISILVIRKQKHDQDMEILNTPIDEEDDDE